MISPETFTRYAAMRVPRYTSYPTAPHFSAEVGEAMYRDWLRSVPPDEPVSVYIHVPFCREMCWYCGCHTTVTHRQAPVSRYVAALEREIDLVAASIPSGLVVGHLHWGGGSPTLLAPEQVERLSSRLRRTFCFAADAEIAVEIDPRTLTLELTDALAKAGVNRASIGVQTFDPAVQKAINRVQGFDVVAGAAGMLRTAGISHLNFDLLYGLPFQTVDSCVATVEQALKLAPGRFAVFGYAHVPGFKSHQRRIDDRALPDLAERLAQANSIGETLMAAGYRAIGLDHFALPDDPLAIAAATGTLHRNFQGYTTDPCPTLIGFGASAIGRLGHGFVQNAARIPDYENRIAEGQLATVRGYALDLNDRRRARIIEQLMSSYRADVSGVDAPLDRLETDGLIRRSGSIIEIVEEAKPLVRVVAAAFDSKLGSTAVRHVTAV